MKNSKVLTKKLRKKVEKLEILFQKKTNADNLRDEIQKKMKLCWSKVQEGKAHLRTFENYADKYQLYKLHSSELSNTIGKTLYEIRVDLEEANKNKIKLEKFTATMGWIFVLSDLVLINEKYGNNGYIEETIQNIQFPEEVFNDFKEQYLKRNTSRIKCFYRDAKELIEKK